MSALLRRRVTRPVGSLSPRAALEVLRREHTPYVPELVEVDDGSGWRAPLWEETAESLLDWWCDGCNRAAERCSVATVLALVDRRAWWRRCWRRAS